MLVLAFSHVSLTGRHDVHVRFHNCHVRIHAFGYSHFPWHVTSVMHVFTCTKGSVRAYAFLCPRCCCTLWYGSVHRNNFSVLTLARAIRLILGVLATLMPPTPSHHGCEDNDDPRQTANSTFEDAALRKVLLPQRQAHR